LLRYFSSGQRLFSGYYLTLVIFSLTDRSEERRPLLYLTRKAEFAASHYYHNLDLSPEENRRIFGKCNKPGGHGRNAYHR